MPHTWQGVLIVNAVPSFNPKHVFGDGGQGAPLALPLAYLDVVLHTSGDDLWEEVTGGLFYDGGVSMQIMPGSSLCSTPCR